MTAYSALEILKTLKADRGAILWLHRERKQAALAISGQPGGIPVSLNDALIAKADPSIRCLPCADGELFAA